MMASEEGIPNEFVVRAQEAAGECGLFGDQRLQHLAAGGDAAIRGFRIQTAQAVAAAANSKKTRAHRAQANNIIGELKILASGEKVSSSYSWLKDFFSVCFDQDIREEVERGNRFSASLKVLSRVIERAGVRTTFYAGADKGLDWLSEKITSVLQSTEWLSWMTKQHAMVAIIGVLALIIQVLVKRRNGPLGFKDLTVASIKALIFAFSPWFVAGPAVSVVDALDDGHTGAPAGSGFWGTMGCMLQNVANETLLFSIFWQPRMMYPLQDVGRGEDPRRWLAVDPNKLLQDREVHPEYQCPITGEILSEPCMLNGHVFDRPAITEWISSRIESGHVPRNPMTQQVVNLNQLATPPLEWCQAYVSYVNLRYELLTAMDG